MHHSTWSLGIALALTFTLSACGSDGPHDTTGDAGVDPTCDPMLDTDEDGLDDCREADLGTALHLPDTDGDGFSDYEEVVELGFSATNNNFKFNPRIADTPRVKVEITSPPSIALLYESSTGTELRHDVERSASSSSAVTTGSSSSTSHAVEWSETVGASVTVGVEVGFPSSSASYEATLSYEASVSTTEESSFEWSEEQTQENQEGLAIAEGLAETQGTSIYGGVIAITVDVENTSDLAYTLSNLAISATMSTPSGNQIVSPVGGLSFDTSQTSFPEFTYAPGQRNGPFVFLNDGLDVATAESLVADSTNLHVNIVAFELTDENGRSFTHNQTAISARTATVIIDYDAADFPFNSERYQVATNVDPDRLRISVADALSDILQIPYETSETGGLIGMRGVSADDTLHSHWAVVHKTSDGVLETVTLYSDAREAYDFAAIELKSGDILHLVYIEDEDEDGLGRRQEEAYATDDLVADTDGDGLLDGYEVNVVRSSPTHADTDGDGVSDYFEHHRFGSDPRNPDSNGNGILDGDDMVSSAALSSADGFGAVVNARGELFLFGVNDFLGVDYGSRPRLYDGSRHWVDVSVGRYAVFVTDSEGDTYAAGDNTNGRLGFGSATTVDTLTPIPGGVRWRELSTLIDHTLAIAEDGTLWGWGNNASSQLGTTSEALWPVRLSVETWRDIAAGWRYSLAIRDDGTLWAAGTNGNGQLGLGDTSPRTTWTQVGTDSDWAQVASNYQHAFAIKEDGTLWAWGSNSGRPLGFGEGDVSSPNVPTRVGTDSDWAQISLGDQHMIGVKTTGTLWGWGQSYESQAGVPDALVYVPTQIGSDSDWVTTTSGILASGAIRMDHTLHTWGAAYDDQLGRNAPLACQIGTVMCSPDPGPILYVRP